MVIQWDEPEAENGPIEVRKKASLEILQVLGRKKCILNNECFIIFFTFNLGLQGILHHQS